MKPLYKNKKDKYGDAEGTVASADDLKISASLIILTKAAADALERHYPGWVWCVRPDERNGIVDIWSGLLADKNKVQILGYTLRTVEFQNDPSMRRVINAGGELLERFGFERGPYNNDKFLARARFLGQLKIDASDKSNRVQRDIRTLELKTALASGHARIVTDADIARARNASANH